MPDERSNAGSGPSASRQDSSTSIPSSPAPPGHAFRRAATVDEAGQFRRMPTLNPLSTDSSVDGLPGVRRRSSNLSDFSIDGRKSTLTAEDLFRSKDGNVGFDNRETFSSNLLPLIFALLPAVGGVFFTDGSAIVTDVMLLALTALVLHWLVTKPWRWYRTAQAIRINEEIMEEQAVEDDSEDELNGASSPLATLGKETAESSPLSPKPPVSPTRTEGRGGRRRKTALGELYVHEVLALLCCFLFPLLGAYLLHAIRSQLSRPSEGLVSNYNLTIYLLAAEFRPVAHLMNLIQSRTLHLQRIVHANPYQVDGKKPTQLHDVLQRLEQLEAHRAAEEASPAQNGKPHPPPKGKDSAALVREVRNAIQPELDALNRAVRRYEKKATVLAFQTESRLSALDTRVEDAISLAAAAAKTSAPQWSLTGWLADMVVSIAILPFHVVIGALAIPFRPLSILFSARKRAKEDKYQQKSVRNGKAASLSRLGERGATRGTRK